MKACFQIAECSLSYAKIVKNIMPRKFYALFFAPFSTFLRNDTPFYALNGKKSSKFRYSPIFALSLQVNLVRSNPFANNIN